MNKSKFSHIYAFLTALFFGSSICYLFFHDTSFTLEHLSQVIYSQATKDGVDIGARASLMYRIVLVGGFFTASIWFVLTRWFIIDSNVKAGTINKIAYLSFVGLVSLYCHVSHTTCLETLGVIVVILLFYFARMLPVSQSFDKAYPILAEANWVEKILLSSFLITYQLKYFGINSHILNVQFAILFFIVLIILSLSAVLYFKKFNKNIGNALVVILCAATYFNIILFEVYSNNFYTSPHYYYSLIYFTGLSFFILMYIIFPGVIDRLSKKNQLSSLSLLSFTTMIVILLSALYIPFAEQITDTFELANPAIPHMRVVKDGEIPLLDFMSSHMISEQFYGYIYHLFFGYEGSLDFHTYHFLYEFLFYILVYLFLNKLFKNPLLALLFVVFFPYSRYFFGRDYFWCILGFYALHRLIIKQTVFTYLNWFSILVLLICWRLDTGAAFLIASPVFLIMAFMTSVQKFHIIPFIKAIGIFAGIVCLGFIIAVQLRSGSYVWDHLHNALSYITSNQAHGTSSQAQQFNHLFYVIHIIVPFCAFISILTIGYSLRYIDRNLESQKYYLLLCSLFFHLIFIANFQRGVVRHNFFMEYDHMLTSTFYLGLLLHIIAFSQQKWKKELMFYVLFGGGFLLILLVKVFHLNAKIPLQNSMESIFMKRESNNQLFSQKKGITKDTIFSANYYENIKTFMDENLSEEQTFFDFSNNPMLYYYCQRSVPSYFCQSLQNTVTDFQQLSQLNKIDTSLVPIVIYQNIPRGWGDQTDDVPNNMRQYLIAEFIYQHYEPYTVINHKAIWTTKSFKSSLDSDPSVTLDTSYKVPLEIDYRNAAHLVSDYYKTYPKDYLRLISKSLAKFHSEDHTYSIDIPENVQHENSIYARLTFDKDMGDRQIKLHESKENGSTIGTFIFRARPGSNVYMLRLTNHFLWHKEGCSVLILEGLPDNIDCNIEFFRDMRL